MTERLGSLATPAAPEAAAPISVTSQDSAVDALAAARAVAVAAQAEAAVAAAKAKAATAQVTVVLGSSPTQNYHLTFWTFLFVSAGDSNPGC